MRGAEPKLLQHLVEAEAAIGDGLELMSPPARLVRRTAIHRRWPARPAAFNGGGKGGNRAGLNGGGKVAETRVLESIENIAAAGSLLLNRRFFGHGTK